MDQKNNEKPEENEESNGLDDILKALNNAGESLSGRPDDPSHVNQEDDDDINNLLKTLIPANQDQANTYDNDQQVSDLSDILTEGIFTIEEYPVGEEGVNDQENERPLLLDSVDDLDERLKSLVANNQDQIVGRLNEESRTQTDKQSGFNKNEMKSSDTEPDGDIQSTRRSSERNRYLDNLSVKEKNNPKEDSDVKDNTVPDNDLEELKQYIRFEEEVEKPKKQSFFKRLNDTSARKDPLVIIVFLALFILMIILIGYIVNQIVDSPAWHPTLAPTSTPLLDNTEPYIIGINYRGEQLTINPVGGSLPNWSPITDEALVIEGSYFCRLIYIKNSYTVFAADQLELGSYLTFNMTRNNNRLFKITDITNSNFEDFSQYSNSQKECVAIYIENSGIVILAEAVN